MKLLRSVAMAFSMFSRFPVPPVEWRKENMRYMLGFLPLVGILLGALYALWWHIAVALSFGQFLFAAGLTALPVLFTGGIHMDGFMDTVDALASHAEPEKKRAILKDSRTGAFAVLYTVLYLLGTFALYTEAAEDISLCLPVCLIPVLSRSGSAVASLVFPVYGGEGLLKTFHDAGEKGAVLLPLGFAAASLAVLALNAPALSVVFLLTEGICLFCVYRMSQKQFGGMSGDLAGFLLTVLELGMLLILILYKAVNPCC